MNRNDAETKARVTAAIIAALDDRTPLYKVDNLDDLDNTAPLPELWGYGRIEDDLERTQSMTPLDLRYRRLESCIVRQEGTVRGRK